MNDEDGPPWQGAAGPAGALFQIKTSAEDEKGYAESRIPFLFSSYLCLEIYFFLCYNCIDRGE